MFPQRNALIRLLRDNDTETVRLVREQLTLGGAKVLPDLHDLLTCDDQQVSRIVREMIQEIETQEAGRAFHALCLHFPDDGDIEDACRLLTQALHPETETSVCGHLLDVWGREFADFAHAAASDQTRVFFRARFMTDHLGFTGNSNAYYDPVNSLLPVVIETRRGIPITLTLVAMLIARRAGYSVEGVNLPGHFIARLGDVLFDPYHRGRILSGSDCAEILARQNLTISPEHLRTATHHAILPRILANLVFSYERAGDTENQEQVINWLAALDRSPGAPFPGAS